MSEFASTDLIKKFTDIINNIPFNRILGLKLHAIEADHITMRFDMTQDLIGNFMHGILHGGVISAVLDMTGGTAAMLAAINKHTEKSLAEMSALLGKASTISMNVDYVSPGRGEHFIAKAWTLHSGTKITFTRMELRNHENSLIAHANGVYRVG